MTSRPRAWDGVPQHEFTDVHQGVRRAVRPPGASACPCTTFSVPPCPNSSAAWAPPSPLPPVPGLRGSCAPASAPAWYRPLSLRRPSTAPPRPRCASRSRKIAPRPLPGTRHPPGPPCAQGQRLWQFNRQPGTTAAASAPLPFRRPLRRTSVSLPPPPRRPTYGTARAAGVGWARASGNCRTAVWTSRASGPSAGRFVEWFSRGSTVMPSYREADDGLRENDLHRVSVGHHGTIE